MKRRMFLRIAGVTTAAAVLPSCKPTELASANTKPTPKKKPNFVFILVDDLGWADLGCFGSSFYETPNLDQLAKEGMKFTDAYAQHPVCSPTRASIMTGKNPCRKEVDITDWIPGERRKKEKLKIPKMNFNMPLKEVSVAEALGKNGYSTYFLGKWHLGETEKHWPKAQGFDVNIGGHHRGSPPGGYYSPYKNPKLPSGPKGEYLTDRLTNEAITLLKNHDRSKPFFLELSFYTVHTPIQACKRHLPKFQAKRKKLLADLKAKGKSADTPYRKEGRGWTRMRQDNAAYATMVYAMDENVGRLLKAIKAQGYEDDTVIFFTGDNGGLATLQWKGAPTCNLPLRAGKGWCYEGGIREATIIKAPGIAKAGSVCDVPAVSCDYYPTMLELAGLPAMPSQHKDGVSLLPALKGGKVLGRDSIVWHYPHYHGSGWTPGSAIRCGDWKLIDFYHDGKVELYNLRDDIGETKDLAAKMPQKTAELRKKLHDYLKEVGASKNTPNPNYNPKASNARKKKPKKKK